MRLESIHVTENNFHKVKEKLLPINILQKRLRSEKRKITAEKMRQPMFGCATVISTSNKNNELHILEKVYENF